MPFGATQKRPKGPPNRLRELRERAGMSMEALAAAVTKRGHPTTASTINKLEKRHIKMTVDWLYRLSDALGVQRWEIMEQMAKLEPGDLELIDTVHGLPEADRAALFRFAEAMKRRD
ncbi:MAG: helix-turn-helix transcriptional regulator [Alphaproteobacteria bacterium]|nr:helix-turn-helix transcriptional regulator [Alphaproteobacteria bacterium]